MPRRPRPFEVIDSEPKKGLQLARAEFTRYTIWHATSTIPWYRRDPEGAAWIFGIDVEALGDLLHRIGLCYHITSTDGFEDVLEQNAILIEDPRWKERIVRERLIFFINQDQGSHQAQLLVNDLDLDSVQDTKLLSIALSFRRDLSVAQRIGLIGRVAKESDDWEVKVHYGGYRGSLWHLLGDDDEARRSFDHAIEAIPEDVTPSWSHRSILFSYAMAGRLHDDSGLLQQGLDVSESFLTSAGDEASLEQDIRSARADLMRRMGRYEDAEREYKRLVEDRGTHDDKIGLARCLVALRRFSEARVHLEQVPYEDLGLGERFDHTYALFGVLYGDEDPSLRDLVQRRLQELDPEFPVWRDLRSTLLLALTRTHSQAPEDLGWWGMIRDHVVLQPNFFGIGVDLKAVVDRIMMRTRGSGELIEGTRAHDPGSVQE